MTDTTSAHAYYDNYWANEDWSTRPPLKLLELFEEHVGSTHRCLDVGCGDGGTSGPWLRDHAAEYVGVDIAESAIALAADRGLDARKIEDAARLPFSDASFDMAACVEVLEHLFEPQSALAEIRRVLTPGGVLIATVPNAAHWRNRIDLALLGRWNPRGDRLSASQPWRDPHVRFFTVASLGQLTKNSGFEIVDHGGHAEHGFAHHIPGVRRLPRSPQAGSTTRRVASLLPQLLAGNLFVVGRTPAQS